MKEAVVVKGVRGVSPEVIAVLGTEPEIETNWGMELGVASTPTLLVSGRLYKGRFDSDAITKLVDSLAPRHAK